MSGNFAGEYRLTAQLGTEGCSETGYIIDLAKTFLLASLAAFFSPYLGTIVISLYSCYRALSGVVTSAQT